KSLERCFLVVDERDHNVASVCRLGFADQGQIAIENAGLNHAVATDLEREMLAGRKKIGRHVDDVTSGLDGLDRGTGRNATHDRNRNRTTTVVLRRCAHPAEITLDYAGREAARAGRPKSVTD